MSPLQVSDHDVQAMVRIAHLCGTDDSQSEMLPWEVLHELSGLIASDGFWVSGADMNIRQRTGFASQDVHGFEDDPPDDDPPDELFWTHYWNDLFCSYPDRTGDLTSVTLTSDFYSTRQWHDTGMYADFAGADGGEHEIRLCLPAGPGRSVRVLLERGAGSDFTERDRALLTLLRPHLHAAYLNTQRRRQGANSLTRRQQEILQYVAAGHTNAQIAHRLHISAGTVRKHLENAFVTLGVTSRTAAVARLDPDRSWLPGQRQTTHPARPSSS